MNSFSQAAPDSDGLSLSDEPSIVKQVISHVSTRGSEENLATLLQVYHESTQTVTQKATQKAKHLTRQVTQRLMHSFSSANLSPSAARKSEHAANSGNVLTRRPVASKNITHRRIEKRKGLSM